MLFNPAFPLRTVWFALAAGLLLAFTGSACKEHSDASAPPRKAPPVLVAVAKISRIDLAQEVVFDAEFRPFQDIDLQSHVAGFVQQMNVDVGDRVKSGHLIAAIEIPEFKEELERAVAVKRRADEDVHRGEEEARRAELDIAKTDAGLKRATAAHAETRTSLDRLETVSRTQPGLIAQQELDVARARETTAAAQVDEARATQASARAGVSVAKSAILALKDAVLVADADIHRLQARLAFTKITAPFDGIVTKRFADVGDLVRGGLVPSAPAVPIVRLVSAGKLRLVFPISVSHVARVKPGAPVEIRIPSLGLKLPGTVARITGEVDAATRTMEAQVDVPNADQALIPGMFASVALRMDWREKALAVPLTGLSRGNPRTALLVKSDGTLEERVVKLGLETASLAEVLSGLTENALIVVGSRSQLKPGQKVETKIVEQPTAD